MTILNAIGLAMSFTAFIFYRQPGVNFWFFGTMWHANKYVTPTGVKLWVGGFSLCLFGTAIGLALIWLGY